MHFPASDARPFTNCAADAFGGLHSPPPSRQVPEALNALEKQVACAIDLMGELTERLGPVLKPEPPACGADKLATASGRSPVADRIDGAGNRAGEIGDLIRRVLGRLDI